MQNANQQLFHNVIFPADTDGAGFWRFNQANFLIWNDPRMRCVRNDLIHSMIGEPRFFLDVNTVMLQRCSDPQSLEYIRFLRNIADQNGMRIIYNLDDVPYGPDVVKQNKGRPWYLGDDVQGRIREMLHLSDIVLTTTDKLREYFHQRYEIPMEKVMCLPNLLPRWWIGSRYNPDIKVERFKRRKSGKLRVGVISSGSHYNIPGFRMREDGQEIMTKDGREWFDEDFKPVPIEDVMRMPYAKDDLDEILDAIDRTVDFVQWVFVGPGSLRQLQKYGNKIQYIGGSGIIHYPQLVASADLDLIVVPCKKDEIFNRCKSNIKWLESCALGVPLLAERVDPTYAQYMPEDQMFNDSDELVQRLRDFTTMSASRYRGILESQWKFINSPTVECGIRLRNWWMEDNMDLTWERLWRMPQIVTEAKKGWIEKANKEQEIWSSDDGCQLAR